MRSVPGPPFGAATRRLRRGRGHPASPRGEVVETGPPASGELADLRAELASLKEQVSALAAASGSIRDDLRREIASLQDVRIARTEPAEEPASPYDAEALASAESERRAVVAETESAFWKEPADTPWSKEASSAVLDALESDAGSRIEVVSLECRTETCRVEVVQDEAGEMTRSLPLLLHRLGPTLPSVTTSEAEYPDGRRGMVLYISAGSGDAAAG